MYVYIYIHITYLVYVYLYYYLYICTYLHTHAYIHTDIYIYTYAPCIYNTYMYILLQIFYPFIWPKSAHDEEGHLTLLCVGFLQMTTGVGGVMCGSSM